MVRRYANGRWDSSRCPADIGTNKCHHRIARQRKVGHFTVELNLASPGVTGVGNYDHQGSIGIFECAVKEIFRRTLRFHAHRCPLYESRKMRHGPELSAVVDLPGF